jgi:anti-sigma regulatory factor (Ser/Thr protein kinase)
MKEICENIIDIVNNSISAGATMIEIQLDENPSKDLLSLSITDNGKGMDSETVKSISDPFYTSKNQKKVGMGTSLLKFHSELSGGQFSISSEPAKGTKVEATFGLTHPDRQPLGDLSGTLLMFLTGNPEIRFTYNHSTDKGIFRIDSMEIKDALGGLELNIPEVRPILKDFINSNLDATS